MALFLGLNDLLLRTSRLGYVLWENISPGLQVETDESCKQSKQPKLHENTISILDINDDDGDDTFVSGDYIVATLDGIAGLVTSINELNFGKMAGLQHAQNVAEGKEERHKVTPWELQLKIVNMCTESHFENRGLIDEKRMDHAMQCGKEVLAASHTDGDVRYASRIALLSSFSIGHGGVVLVNSPLDLRIAILPVPFD
jgi:hypothetical protein